MDLKTYLTPLDAEAREKFASSCGTSAGHLQNVMYGVRPCAPALAVLIEHHSKGAVTRQELRPDWKAIWPELADPKKAPRSPDSHPGQRADDKPKARARSIGTNKPQARAA